MSQPLVYTQGRRLALGAGAASAHWFGEEALFALTDGHVLIAHEKEQTRRVEAHDGAILCAVRHPDKATLITGGDDGKLKLVSPAGDVTLFADLGSKWIDHVVASPTSGVIVAGVGKQAIVFKNGAESHRFAYPTTIGGLAIDAKGRRLAASHYNGATVRYALISDDKGTALNWAGSHLAITLSPEADYVITAMQELSLHGWKLPEKTDLRMTGYGAKTRSFSWDKRGRWLATSGADVAVIWPFVGKLGPQGKEPILLGGRSEKLVTCVAFHPSEEILAIGYEDGAAVAVRLADQIIISLDEPGEGPVTALAWSQDGMRLAIGDEAGRGAIVDLKAP